MNEEGREEGALVQQADSKVEEWHRRGCSRWAGGCQKDVRGEREGRERVGSQQGAVGGAAHLQVVCELVCVDRLVEGPSPLVSLEILQDTHALLGDDVRDPLGMGLCEGSALRRAKLLFLARNPPRGLECLGRGGTGRHAEACVHRMGRQTRRTKRGRQKEGKRWAWDG